MASCFIKLFLIHAVFFFPVSPAAPWTSSGVWGSLGWKALGWRYWCHPALASRPEGSPVNTAWSAGVSAHPLGNISCVSQMEEFQPRGEMLYIRSQKESFWRRANGTSLDSKLGSVVTLHHFHSMAFSLGWKSLGVLSSYGNFICDGDEGELFKMCCHDTLFCINLGNIFFS